MSINKALKGHTVKSSSPLHHISEKLSQAYQHVLAHALHTVQQGGGVLHQVLDEVKDELREDATALADLSRDEVALLQAYIKRDLVDAATYLDTTGKELKDWLGFDLALIESRLFSQFAQAADQTALALIEIKQQAALAPYSTGELAGIGTLVCDQCGHALHFHKPGHIPPCAKCHGTHFHRADF